MQLRAEMANSASHDDGQASKMAAAESLAGVACKSNLYKQCSKTGSQNILPCNSNSCKHCSKTGGLKTEIRIVLNGCDMTVCRSHVFGSRCFWICHFPLWPFTAIVTSHKKNQPPPPPPS